MSDLGERPHHSGALAVLILVVGLIVYGSLYPFRFLSIATPFYVWELPGGLSTIRDVAINVGMYFPLGFLGLNVLREAHTRRWSLMGSLVGTVGFAFLLSAALEWLQAYDQGRVSSAVDLTLNTLGGGLGAIAAGFLGVKLPNSFWMARRPVPAALLFIAVACRLFPFFPRVHAYQLKAALANFLHTPFSLFEVIAAAIIWMSFRILLAALLRRSRVTAEFACFIALIPIGLLMVDQSPTRMQLAGAVVALIIGHWWHPSCREFAPVLVAGIVLRELTPFRFATPPSAFSWIPFAGFLSAMPVSVAITLDKLEVYGAGIWFLRHYAGFEKAAFGLAVLLFGMEMLQCYQPGRTPEITDALLVLIGGASLKVMARYSPVLAPENAEL